MTEHPVSRGRAFVSRVHLFMGVLALVLAAGITVIGVREALAALAGGMAVLLPQVFVARRLLQPMGARQAAQFAFSLWVYQGLKWLLTIMALLAAFFGFREQALYVFTGFIVIFQGQWIVPLVLARKGKS